MKRTIFFLTLSSFFNFMSSQTNFPSGKVGINTANPQRTLHVEGNLKIANVKDASENGAYTNVLITNAAGDVDHALRSDFLPVQDATTSQKEVFNSIYNRPDGTADATKTVTCRKFVFLFENSGSNTNIRFKLKEEPLTDVNVYVSMEQNWSENGFEFFQGTNNSNSSPFTFVKSPANSTNYWNKPHDFAQSMVADYEQNVIHFQYPNDAAFYRLTIYKVKQSNSKDFVTVCEKF